ncbi:hypothetical protein PV325_008114 [Microctonus aethiopoides]|nr:hypothetical protein PV325_008114 [Microctonus aethiopoides]
MSKAEYNRQYRTPVLPAPLTQSSPDAGPTVIQHESVTVYNSVNKKVRNVIDFRHEALLAYTKGGLKQCKSHARKHETVQFHHFPKRKDSLVKIINNFNQEEAIDRHDAWVKFLKMGKKISPEEVCSRHLTGDDYIPSRDKGAKDIMELGSSYEVQRALKNMEIGHKFRLGHFVLNTIPKRATENSSFCLCS